MDFLQCRLLGTPRSSPYGISRVRTLSVAGRPRYGPGWPRCPPPADCGPAKVGDLGATRSRPESLSASTHRNLSVIGTWRYSVLLALAHQPAVRIAQIALLDRQRKASRLAAIGCLPLAPPVLITQRRHLGRSYVDPLGLGARLGPRPIRGADAPGLDDRSLKACPACDLSVGSAWGSSSPSPSAAAARSIRSTMSSLSCSILAGPQHKSPNSFIARTGLELAAVDAARAFMP